MAEVFVARDSELTDGDRRVISADGVEIGVFRVAGALYGWRNECPHSGGPVCQGRTIRGVEERIDADRKSLGIHFVDGSAHVVCPWHGFEFDITTGRHAGTEKVRLKNHAVKVRDGDIYVVV
jgi:nitrite reductase/ring-hydroxylating ferredoxin subunit